MSALITPLLTFSNSCPSQEAFPARDTPEGHAVTTMLNRVSVFFSHMGKCPILVADAMPEVWPIVQRLIELGSKIEPVVESAIKVIMCVHVRSYVLLLLAFWPG